MFVLDGSLKLIHMFIVDILNDHSITFPAMIDWLHAQMAEFYEGICKLVKRYDKCLNLLKNSKKAVVFSYACFIFTAKRSLISKVPS